MAKSLRIVPSLHESMRRMGFLVITSIVLLFTRTQLMGAQLPVFTRFDNPASTAATPFRQLTYNYLLSVNSWLLLCPSWLCCDWTMGTIPLIESIFDYRNLATLVFYIILFLFIYVVAISNQPQTKSLMMGLAFLSFPFVPASNLFFPVGFVVAERVLYTPSMGFCLIVAQGLCRLLYKFKHMKSAIYICLILIVVTHSCKTILRNFDWYSEYSLFKAALRINQQNAKLFNNVGHALEAETNYSEALIYFQQAARVQPDDIGAHINVGRTLRVLHRDHEAEEAYRKALSLIPTSKPGMSYTARVAPSHLNVFINLGNLISQNASRLEEADMLYRSAISLRSDFTKAYINRGDVLIKLNRTSEAREQYFIALRYEPDNPDLYYNLGVVSLDSNQRLEALEYFHKALEIDPDHKLSLFNSAVLIQESGNSTLRSLAIHRLKRLLSADMNNEMAYFNLAMLLMDDGQMGEAEQSFRKAIELKEDFRSALFNLALMLVNDLNRPLEAVSFLEQLLKFHPTHSNGLILLGDININHLHNLDAAELNFKAILQWEPNNIQARHNLCVIEVERGRLKEAERCLVEVQQLAPEEQYIANHLSIIRQRIAKNK